MAYHLTRIDLSGSERFDDQRPPDFHVDVFQVFDGFGTGSFSLAAEDVRPVSDHRQPLLMVKQDPPVHCRKFDRRRLIRSAAVAS
jgi:hypothetical protein